MEVGELVSAFISLLDKEPYCDNKAPKSKDWKARVNKWGIEKNCSGTRLYEQMEKSTTWGYLGGPTPFVAKSSPPWNLAKCTTEQFPIQAHHLIPKNYLPDHPVCAFLAEGYTKNRRFKLTADTPYDTDHAHNGYCMPYATPLAEWKDAGSDQNQKLQVAFDVMEKTQRQLHQGSHRTAAYSEAPVADAEEASIHKGGYLNRVKQFLNAVFAGAVNHANQCSICKPDKDKRDIEPVESMCRHMDQVSGLIKLIVDANHEFVSEVAYLKWKADKENIVKPDWM